MADNYIGNRMDDYLAGKLNAPRRPKLTPSGRRPGSLEMHIQVSEPVWISTGGLLAAGLRLIEQLRNAGVPVSYRAPDGKAGSGPAIQYGARHIPPSAPGPAPVAAEVRISPERIEINGTQAEIIYASERAAEAADIAAALLSSAGSQVSSAKISLLN